jgi:ABC-type multidrug transport system fused ATPase/permease subunit
MKMCGHNDGSRLMTCIVESQIICAVDTYLYAIELLPCSKTGACWYHTSLRWGLVDESNKFRSEGAKMNRASDLGWIFKRLRPYTKRISFGLGLAFLVGSITTVDPLLLRHLIDKSLPQRSLVGSLVTAILMALCFVGRSVAGAFGRLLSFRITQFISQDLKVDLLTHMTTLSAEWHEQTFLGEKISRIEQDVDQISQFGADITNSALGAIIFIVLNLAIMLALSWQLTISILPLLASFLWIRTHFRSLIQERADRAQAEIGNASGRLAEHLSAIPQIQGLGAERARVARTVTAWVELIGAQWAQCRTQVAFTFSVMVILSVAMLVVLMLGSREYLSGTLSLGGFVAFYEYAVRVFDPVWTVMEQYSRMQHVFASVRRAREVLDTVPSVPDNGKIMAIRLPLLNGVLYDKVFFAYPSSKFAIRNVSLRIGRGERVAIIGKSGSGKSTLSRLLVRMADPTCGQVVLETKPATEYSLRALRQTICYLPQQPILFSGTIRENLLCANENAAAAEIDQAIEVAQLKPVLDRLPHGLETMLGPEAVGLSGGERQRLSVARALLRRSAILVLDESTSALDVPTEQALFRSITNFRDNTSLVLISHRLQSLTWVDRIIVLDSGEVVAQGTHDELYSSCALYRGLYERDAPTTVDQPQELRSF